MNPDYIPILTTIISVVGSLLVAYGTWTVSMKQARKKEHDEIMELLEEHRKETQKDIRALQDELTDTKAVMQNKISIIEIKIDTLSEMVEKHNGVIERTYILEQKSAVQEEQIKVANHRIEDLEKKPK